MGHVSGVEGTLLDAVEGIIVKLEINNGATGPRTTAPEITVRILNTHQQTLRNSQSRLICSMWRSCQYGVGMANHTDDLRLAHILADNADSLTMSRFGARDLTISTKPDHSEVTDADLAVEDSVRRTLSRMRSRDAVHGEERGDTGDGPRRWIIDPIDGTANFLRGVAVWATLIALSVEDEIVASVVSAPALKRRWWAARGLGAWTGKSLASETPIHVSNVRSLDDAFLSYSSLHGWVESGRGRGFGELMRSVWRTRAFGDFWSYMMVAEGVVDLACEPELGLHDMAALDIIVTEAGGKFTGLDGRDGPWSGNAMASNGFLHTEALAMVQPEP